MKVSLIITTYNWKEALKVVIDRVRVQSVLPHEVIIADDGSRSDTKEMLDRMRSELPIPLIHSWHADNGFRAAESRNKAIARATGDYIVLIDGDILIGKHFIEDHIKYAKRKQVIQGGRVLMNQARTDSYFCHNKIPKFFTSGIRNRKNIIRNKILSSVFSRRSYKTKRTRTCNMSFFREDAIAINGFNHDFIGWGCEDDEFVVRLKNHGVIMLSLKFAANCFHLHHAENNRKAIQENLNLLNEAIEKNLIRCERGIDQFFGE